MHINSNDKHIDLLVEEFQRELPLLDNSTHLAAAHIFWQNRGDLEHFKVSIKYVVEDPEAHNLVIEVAEKIFKNHGGASNLKRKREEMPSIGQKRPRSNFETSFNSPHEQVISAFTSLLVEWDANVKLLGPTDAKQLLEDSFKQMTDLLKIENPVILLDVVNSLNFLSAQQRLPEEMGLEMLSLVKNFFHHSNSDFHAIAYLCFGNFAKLGLQYSYLQPSAMETILAKASSYFDDADTQAIKALSFFLSAIQLCYEEAAVFDTLTFLSGLFSITNSSTLKKAVLQKLLNSWEDEHMPLAIKGRYTEEMVYTLLHKDRELSFLSLIMLNKIMGLNKKSLEYTCSMDFSTLRFDAYAHRMGLNVKILSEPIDFETESVDFLDIDIQNTILTGCFNTLKFADEIGDEQFEEKCKLLQQALYCLTAFNLTGVKLIDKLDKHNFWNLNAIMNPPNDLDTQQAIANFQIIIALDPSREEDDYDVLHAFENLHSMLLDDNMQNKHLILAGLCGLISPKLYNSPHFNKLLVLENMTNLMNAEDNNLSAFAMAFCAELRFHCAAALFESEVNEHLIMAAYLDNITSSDCNFSRKSWTLKCFYNYFSSVCVKKNGISLFINVLASTLTTRSVDSSALRDCLQILSDFGIWQRHLHIDKAPQLTLNAAGPVLRNLFPDFAVQCKEKAISCHKNILATHSDYFLQLFSNWTHAGNAAITNLHDIDTSVFEKIVKWMYGEKIYLSHLDELLSIFKVADQLLMQSLRNECSSLIINNISMQTAPDLLNYAVENLDQELQLWVIGWMLTNMGSLSPELMCILNDNIESFCLFFADKMAPQLIANLQWRP